MSKFKEEFNFGSECVWRRDLTSPRALVVEEDPVDGEHVVGLSEVHHDPVGVELCSTWVERQRRGEFYFVYSQQISEHNDFINWLCVTFNTGGGRNTLLAADTDSVL